MLLKIKCLKEHVPLVLEQTINPELVQIQHNKITSNLTIPFVTINSIYLRVLKIPHEATQVIGKEVITRKAIYTEKLEYMVFISCPTINWQKQKQRYLAHKLIEITG